jgi:hypothetical protein
MEKLGRGGRLQAALSPEQRREGVWGTKSPR